MTEWWMGAVVAVALATTGCGDDGDGGAPDVGACGCTMLGDCRAGDTDDACGAGGGACQICAAGTATCVEGDCRLLCQRTSSCSELTDACLSGVCRPPWGRTVTLSSLRATLPLVHSSYDDDTGNAPDPYLILTVDGVELARTAIVADTKMPSWSETLSFTLDELVPVSVVVWDSDQAESSVDDLVGGVEFQSGAQFMETAGHFEAFDGIAGAIDNLAFDVAIE